MHKYEPFPSTTKQIILCRSVLCVRNFTFCVGMEPGPQVQAGQDTGSEAIIDLSQIQTVCSVCPHLPVTDPQDQVLCASADALLAPLG